MMASPSTNILKALRKYRNEGELQGLEALNVEDGVGGRNIQQLSQANYEARLDRTLEELKERVKEQEEALQKLRQSSREPPTEPSPDPAVRLHQLRIIKSTYDSLSTEPSSVPSPDSALPIILAIRHTHRLITETSASIEAVQSEISTAQALLEYEQSSLRDSRLITEGLEARIAELRTAQEERTHKTPADAAKETLSDLQRQKTAYERETKRLVKAFNEFIEEHLAAMLAAEELGGPVVGGLVEIGDETLQAGFSQHGKARKVKSGLDEDKRQRRIDEIWGPKGGDEDGGGLEKDGRSEKEVAGTEMRRLTEKLLNASSSADGGGSGQYVVLERDSAAARFLVRAKVAHFHPRDATRLRLIDFGRELDVY